MYRLDNINCIKLPSTRLLRHITWSEGTCKNHSFQWTVTFSIKNEWHPFG